MRRIVVVVAGEGQDSALEDLLQANGWEPWIVGEWPPNGEFPSPAKKPVKTRSPEDPMERKQAWKARRRDKHGM